MSRNKPPTTPWTRQRPASQAKVCGNQLFLVTKLLTPVGIARTVGLREYVQERLFASYGASERK